MYPLHSIKMRELQLKFQSDAHTVKKNKLKKSVTQFLWVYDQNNKENQPKQKIFSFFMLFI